MRVFGFIFFCFTAFTVLFSCGVKTKFNDAEMKWYNSYKFGDTLIFKSDKNIFDTTYIFKKELFYPNYNPIESHGSYLPQWAVVWYKNKNLYFHPEGERLLAMEKKSPKNNTFITIQYLNSVFFIENIEMLHPILNENDRIYELNEFGGKFKADNPKIIYWHEYFGIVKYITYDGVAWNRINMRY